MIKNPDVTQILEEFKIIPSGEPISLDDASRHICIFVDISRDQKNRQQPSNKTLGSARKALKNKGIEVDFFLKDALTRDIEAGLRATVLYALGGEIRNVFLSVKGKVAHVWIDSKRQFDEVIQKQVTEKASAYLTALNLDLGSVSSTTGENLPSSFTLLRAIRQFSPVNSQMLCDFLNTKEFTIPSADWLNRRLDALRKVGKIIRLSNGHYVVPLATLHDLGTSKGKRSPDVTRLLALARRTRYS